MLYSYFFTMVFDFAFEAIKSDLKTQGNWLEFAFMRIQRYQRCDHNDANICVFQVPHWVVSDLRAKTKFDWPIKGGLDFRKKSNQKKSSPDPNMEDPSPPPLDLLITGHANGCVVLWSISYGSVVKKLYSLNTADLYEVDSISQTSQVSSHKVKYLISFILLLSSNT